MELIAGVLVINGLSSSLKVGQKIFWLLRSGFLNPNQAAAAATNYIVNSQNLEEGPVIVTGTKSLIGTQPIIIMSDINAAGSLANHETFPKLEADIFNLEGVALALGPKPSPKPKKKAAKKKPAKKPNT